MSPVAVAFPQEVPQKMKGRIIKWKRKIDRIGLMKERKLS